jgi:hypothetical protein
VTERDALRSELDTATDVRLLRAALESTLDFMDEISLRRSEDPAYVAVRTRQLIARRLRGLTAWGTTPPPEVPRD